MDQLKNNLSVNDSFTKKGKNNRKRNRLTMDAVKNNSVIENVDMNESRAEKESGNMQNGSTTLSPTKKPKRNSVKNSENIDMNGSHVEKEPDNIQNGNTTLSPAKKIKKDKVKNNSVTAENADMNESCTEKETDNMQNGNTTPTPKKKSKKDKKKLNKSMTLNQSVEENEHDVEKNGEKKHDKSLILNKSVEETETDVKEEPATIAEDFIALESTQPEENEDPTNNVTADSTNPPAAPRYTPEDIVRTVFVANIPKVVKFFELMRLFTWAGKVVRINFLKGAAPKAGVRAFVILEDETIAKKALELDGIFFYGRNLQVTKVQKTIGEAENTIFVGNVANNVTEEKLRKIFRDCGEIDYVKRMPVNLGNCTSFVCFKSPESVSLALELNNTEVNGRHIFVQRYDPQRKEALIKRGLRDEGQQKNGFRRFEKNTKARNNKESQFKPKFETKPKKTSEFRGVKTTLNKVQKVKKPKKEKMEWVIEQVAPKPVKSNE